MRNIKTKLQKATSTRRGRAFLILLFILILSVAGGGWYYWNTHKKRLIRETLENAVHEKTEGLYLIRYDSLNLDEVAGDLSVRNITLVYDSVKFHALQETKEAPSILLRLEIQSIEVSGVKTPLALVDNEIVGKKIHIRNPIIQIIYTGEGEDSGRVVPNEEIYKQILGDLNKIQVDTVEISGASIITKTLKSGKENIRLKNASIRLMEVAVDSVASNDDDRLLFSRQIALSVENVSWVSDDNFYKFVSDSIVINTSARSAYINSFHIKPTLSEDEFVKKRRTQDDRFDFSFGRITIHNLDMPGLFDEHVTADNIHIGSASLKIYRDLSIPRDKKSRVGSYPHQILEKIPVPVTIKKIVLPGAFVEYKERNPRTTLAGKVQFHNTYATLTNVTNDKQAISKDNIMTAVTRTRFMNMTPFRVVWRFYLGHAKGRFDLKGDLGSFRFADVNVLTEPMGPARLDEGKLNDLQFNLSGSDYNMNGTVKMLYEDLKVSILEKEEGTKKLDKKNVASIAANIMIKNSNPEKKKDDPKIITLEMERNTNRSIFYFVWKSLLKGIKETVGIKK